MNYLKISVKDGIPRHIEQSADDPAEGPLSYGELAFAFATLVPQMMLASAKEEEKGEQASPLVIADQQTAKDLLSSKPFPKRSG